ncbi:MAP kinase [Mycena maculata]|uniref:MAP kinase n=1 Tax=Mycena maculata TaxID=230809 RepID=A0AAD7P1C8_9AGAR|nr:MAP kinase [Mycena maculata]
MRPPPPLKGPRRPTASPTASTPDSYSSHSVSDRVLILVTADSERYVNVDISGAANPAFIRECVFTKLNIFDEEDQSHFSIYRTEIGSFAIGDALSDEKLFELCRELGDEKGSLKLLVSHSSARVHEPPPALRPASSLSPTSGSTILPPFIPFNTFPLQPRRRSRSRNGSVSSTSENLVPEATAGYEADHERERSAGTNGLVIPNGRSPGRPASPLPQPSRSSSPLPPIRIAAPLYDRNGNLVPPPPPPPPLSPHRATFNINNEDNNVTPPGTQIRVSDAAPAPTPAPEKPPPSEQSEESPRHWRNRPQPSPRTTKVDTSSRRNRAPQHQSDTEDSPSQSESWVMVNDTDHPVTPVEARHSPSGIARAAAKQLSPRYNKPTSPYTNRPLAIPAPPRNAPPPVPVMSPETRIAQPSRLAGQPVPPQWLVASNRADRPDQKPMPSSSSHWGRLTKGAKSMDNLRGSALSHPTTLQPGGGRGRAPPLPVTRGSGIRDALLSAGTSPGTPKSYDGRPIRPLPIQGSTIHEFSPVGQSPYGTRTPGGYPSNLMSPNNDPYPRPQSAFGGDTVTSPNSRSRQTSTSNFGSGLESEYGRWPRAPSPTHPFPTSTTLPYRSSTNRHAERHSDPLHSPASPRSPRFVPREQNRRPGSSSGNSDTHAPPEITATHTSDDTVVDDVSRWAAEQFTQLQFSGSGSGSGTIMPETATFVPSHNPDAGTSSGVGTNVSNGSFDSDSDDGDTGTWQKPPTAERPKSILRGPPLTVKIENNTDGLKPAAGLSTQHTTFATPTPPARGPTPPAPPPKPRKDVRASTFTVREENTWAPRPPPEDVYERLEDFFPEHDLDKPVIEAISGGTSPTGTSGGADHPLVTAPPVPPPERDKSRVRGKKSIRLVAQERKKFIDRTSRGGDALTAIQRKRSTKLWGSKVEEVDTSNLPESPSTSEGATTFKWVRGELIGRGTYGRVYLALNATTGEMIAVKQVEIPRTASDKNDSRQVTVVQALKLESETLKVLDHPNIVQYLGFEETPANLSIFLEYVPGGSIGSCLLKHGKFDEEVTKSFTSQILAGLEYLHSKGILHRDLKSDNILVEMSGVCKISDFGISKRTDDQNDAHTAMQGTVFWMAPEVINTAKKGYSFKIDIWSIGCVVLEMWAGTRPWLGEEMVAVMFKLFQSKLPPPVPDGLVLSPLADDFRKKCFAINPEERPPAAELRKHPYLTLDPGWVFDGFTAK